MKIPHTAVNRNVFFVAVDATDLKTRETGLSGFTVRYQLDDGTETGMTTPTVTEVSAGNQPGVYRLLIDESGMTTLTAGSDNEELVLHITHASMAPVTRAIEIYRPKFTEGQSATMGNSAAHVNVERWRDSVPNALVSNRVDASVGAMAANVLTATAINADAITAAKVSADVGLEIADAVWDEAKAGHVAAGSFGEEVQQLAKPGEICGLWLAPISTANAQCHFALRVVNAAGAAVTGLTIGSFTWDIFNQDLTDIGDPAQLDEAASGLYLGYFETLDPTAHIMRVSHATHFPAGLVGATSNYDQTIDTLFTALPDLVWDEILTGATHNIANSAGKRLRTIDTAFEVHSGTAQAGSTATTFVMDTGANGTTNNIYRGDRIVITGGTGVGEHGIILSYVAATRTATMSQSWVITPDATSEFSVVPADVDIETWNHNAVTGDGDWAELQTDVDAILVDTDTTIPALIAALNDVSTADLAVAASDALGEIGLQFLVAQPVTGPDVVNNSIFAKLVSDQSPADFDDLDTTTSLSGLASNLGTISSNTIISILQTDDIPGDVQTGLTAQGYTGARAVKLDNLDIPVSTLVDLILDEALAGHLTAGTVGEALSLISDALETFKNKATVVVEGGGTKLVTIYETDDTTIKYQVRISADGLTRTRL